MDDRTRFFSALLLLLERRSHDWHILFFIELAKKKNDTPFCTYICTSARAGRIVYCSAPYLLFIIIRSHQLFWGPEGERFVLSFRITIQKIDRLGRN